MAVSKFVMALLFTCFSLANPDSSRNRPWKKTEMVNLDDETDVKEPEQVLPEPYETNCPNGCCYVGRNYCLSCCRYPHEKTNSVGMQKRGHGGCKYGCCGSYVYGQCSACCSRNQIAENAKEQEATPVWTQVQP